MSKYITVENFTRRQARKEIEWHQSVIEMNRSHGSPEEETQEHVKKIKLLKTYWKLRWNEEYHDRGEYGMYKPLGLLVE